MSDIELRFDGLLVAVVLLLAAIIYLFVALIAFLAGANGGPKRARRMMAARTAMLFAVLNGIGFGLMLVYMDQAPPPMGPDRVDWLALPAALLFVAGCIVIAVRKPRAG